MAYLYLGRHAKSEWNDKGIWTGWADPHLSKEGFDDALKAGQALKGRKIDKAYVAPFFRTRETLETIEEAYGAKIEKIEAAEIKERDYGVLTGKNKWQVKEAVGEEQFQKIRRGWDVPIEKGESLKDVYNRVIPYFKSQILPELLAGKNVIIVSSGNALRALVKFIENIPDEKIGEVEIVMGQIHKYIYDGDGKYIGKEVVYSGTVDTQNTK
ncbi:MAG: hypothetical protein A3H57_04365 [Candidatus Taylorbacteria bacterium RIFCSPLOWO2_02_FULL_43_11]|uniref:phosphoglycerate mutase (2,3-diphosphoglycerate-dependent) n=1 Tax=Candidatus Taylorbacteria bacterium RIFCSPHIGHO2_02_FULL_43_32b TaxID=1802306 RepID=A0A1G2MHB4_9BACT|nr:MAG: hypothetical protein A2743_02105 [Candidatus Taylorbacteria bacterium RIFCSPHIGHO2_01_FULL_43_47]OHA22431.1 MAG: hypothetical protein A3C72_03315 [Candidatus Taylorbacteria bacterium RIFCSPHIGHO2_02_FULL_43_32b]OHA31620.1 MAG: hypothetical protein A3B08_04025 [Candidatus Taylorbacteria bacterium RIFCSPLOWO2_01_FULL_43_44]OHA36200.1 MAG: hypothetical protein A3H57_04365 [Candidatus Taylorbacteria bacterium RIFCSPLOWO2_02_FULL_43_11]